MSIILTRNEWHLDQGLVGYKRILEHAGVKVITTDEGIVFEEHQLDKLPSAYFKYFLDKYRVSKREENYLLPLWNKFKSEQKIEIKKDLDKRLKEQYESKVLKYFPDSIEGKRLVANIERFRSEKIYSTELDSLFQSIIEDIKVDYIDEKLTLNYFKSVILRSYYGQDSFLNVSMNTLTLEEQIDRLHNDYIRPVKDELEFMKLLDSAENSTDIQNFLETVTHHGLQSLKKTFKKMSLNEIKKYIQENVNCCSFFDNFFGFENFNEGTFSPLAISVSNSINFSWNSNGKTSIPISSLAKLILFCAAAGATTSGSKSTFVQNEGSFEELVRINEHFSNEKNRDKAFDEIIFDLAREQKLKAKYTTQSYFIIEYESDYQAKKTILDYMVLTPQLCKLFIQHNELFVKMPFRLRNGIIHDLLNNIDTKHRLLQELREKIREQYSPLEIQYGVIIRHLYQCYLKGGKGMQIDVKKQSNKVWNLYFSGREIQQAIGEKKAQGLAYRLLNATKAGDKKQFMDTIMRIYISAEKQMPAALLNVLHEEEMDFATVADAWIAGLISKKNDRGDDQNDTE